MPPTQIDRAGAQRTHASVAEVTALACKRGVDEQIMLTPVRCDTLRRRTIPFRAGNTGDQR